MKAAYEKPAVESKSCFNELNNNQAMNESDFFHRGWEEKVGSLQWFESGEEKIIQNAIKRKKRSIISFRIIHRSMFLKFVVIIVQ